MNFSAPVSSPDDAGLLDHLNPEQRAAVTASGGHSLVLAGAGSGKTRVLTTRIAWLLQTGQTGPAGVLAVTFTNKAAKEMLTRLGALLALNVRGMWIGTFHGLCNRLLRAHHQAAGLPATFQILDVQDQASALKRVYKAADIDDQRHPLKAVQWFINGCKDDALRPDAVPRRDAETAARIEIYRAYEAQCAREGVVDFAELLLRAYELLRDHEAIRSHYQRRFRHILIDEFQDTSRLQYLWIKQLAGVDSSAGGGACVMAVGDDDQSIYAFRGARVGNMNDFLREFGVAQTIKLEENYRSGSHILDAANALIDHNAQRLGKNLRTAQGPGEPVRLFEAASDFQEAQWVVDEIRAQAAQGQALREVAVLYRSNAQSRVIENALFAAGVAYKVTGGLRFFERAEIKHALAYLRLLENPRDDTSFLRVVNFPPRGIGLRSLELLGDAARTHGVALVDAVGQVGGAAGAKLTAFVAGLDVLREAIQGLTLHEIIDRVLQASALLAHYRAERDGQDRVENLEELVNAAESFVTQEGFGRDAVALPLDEVGAGSGAGAAADSTALDGAAGADSGVTLSPLAAFLTHAALEAGDTQAGAGQDAVQLMTVHASKGLEFDTVFITGLEEGLFPHEQSAADRAGLEEERRLMYVAITRARKRLTLSHAQSRLLHGQTRFNLASRFLDELPEAGLKRLSTRRRSAPDFVAAHASGTGDTGLFSAHVASPPRSPQAVAGLRKGQLVFHNSFGQGRVLALEGQGDQARAQVDFSRHGSKWLALAVAKLTPVD